MSCDRFHREGAAQLERGEALDAHYSSCVDCRRELETHERIVRAMQEMSKVAPREDWQARVLARIDAEPPAAQVIPFWSRRMFLSGLAAAAAILIAVLVFGERASPRVYPLRPRVFVLEPETAKVRGSGPQLRDRLVVRGDVAWELRVYFNESELLLSCRRDPAACRLEGEDHVAEVALESAGRYRVVAWIEKTPLDRASEGFDRDLAAALQAGAQVIIEAPIDVR